MRTFVLLLALMAFGTPTLSQAQDIELPTYTPEERWTRASNQLALGWIVGIRHAKAMGKTAADYGKFAVEMFAPGWGEPGSGTLNIVTGMNRNYQMFYNTEFEIVDQSATHVTARYNRPWKQYFGDDGVWYGITVEEYEETFEVFNASLSDYLGLGYEGWVEGDWGYIKFTTGG